MNVGTPTFENASLIDLINVDGFHGVCGSHTEASFREVVSQVAKKFQISDVSRIFEIGCGAGAFLRVLETEYSTNVGGVDFSLELIEIAKRNVQASLSLFHEEASYKLNVKDVDICFAHSVFHYFPDNNYASKVMENMASYLKQESGEQSGIAILDVRDMDKSKEYENFRSGTDSRVTLSDIGHTMFTKSFFRDFLRNLGFAKIVIEDRSFSTQYGNSAYSFDVYAFNLK
jgi:SAM-dependent methyltransferase